MLDQFGLDQLETLDKIGIAVITMGLPFVYTGYGMYERLLGFIGFLTGAIIGTGVGVLFLGPFGLFLGIFIGFVFARLAMSFHQVIAALTGAAVGGSLFALISFGIFEISSIALFGFMIGAGIGGWLAIIFYKYQIFVTTAGIGSLIVSSGVSLITGPGAVVGYIHILVFVSGVYFQHKIYGTG